MDDYEDSFEQTSSSSSDSNTESLRSSQAIRSPIPKPLHSPASQITAAPVQQSVISTNNDRIEETTPDMVQEASQHRFLTHGSTTSLIDSVSGVANLEEQKRVANIEENKTVFNLLSEFEAFRSLSHSSDEKGRMEDGFPSPSDRSGKIGNLANVTQPSKAEAASTHSVSTSKKKQKLVHKDSIFREGSSSLFSTLSQHLKAAKQTAVPIDAVSGAAPVACENPLPLQEMKSTIQHNVPRANSLVQSEITPSSLPNIKSAAPPVQPLLPDLPVSSLNLKKNIKASVGPSAIRPMSASRTNMLVTNTASDVVLPLPPPRVVQLPPEAQSLGLDPKLVELRETSEAVERLVKAFALLRNQCKEGSHSDHVDPLQPFQQPVKETLTSTAFHKVHGDSTVRAVSTKKKSQSPHDRSLHFSSHLHSQHPGSPAPLLTADDIAALKSNEAKVEETLMACVLEMLKRDLTEPRRVQALVNGLKAHPPHETITAEEFKINAIAFGSNVSAAATDNHQNSRRHCDTYSVFDGDMRAFDGGDDDAATMLFHSIQDGIHKYVFHHVINPMVKSVTTGRCAAFPITPHFSWILLLDLLAVCENISMLGFNECGTPTGLLLVRYDGDSSCESIARNAIQCLPFEPLETFDSLKKDKPVFRLEFWVTKDKMQIVIAAITDCIRQHIVHEARVRPYMALLEGDTEIHPTVLVPSKLPLFSFIRPDTPGDTTFTTANGHAVPYGPGRYSSKDFLRKQDLTKHRGSLQEDENMLGMNHRALQAMAYAISVITTGILDSFTSPEARKGPSPFPSLHNPMDYEDLSKIVAETICELTEDIAIKASIQRRARDKFINLQKKKKEFPDKESLEKERLVIERAEKEVNDMINRIVQQMSLKSSHK